MSNDLIPFDFEDQLVRIVMVDGDARPWFVATDVAKVLGYRDAANMTRILDEDERGTHNVSTPYSDQPVSIISESGLYAAIFKSRRPEARRFRKWVTSEVLPTVLRTGRYELPGAEQSPELREPGSDIDARDLAAKVGAVRLCLRLHGADVARNLWIDIGLPLRIADARACYRDAIAGPLAAWLAEHEPSTTAEITGGLGLDPANAADRRRVTTVLHMLGWWSKRTRRGMDLAWCWYAPEPAAAEG